MRQNPRFTVVGGVVLLATTIGAARPNPPGDDIPPPRPVEPKTAKAEEEPRWVPAPADSALRKVTLPVRVPQVVSEERQLPPATGPASPGRPAAEPVTPARLAAEAVKTGPPAVGSAARMPPTKPAPPAAAGDSVVIVGGVAVPLPPDTPTRRGP